MRPLAACQSRTVDDAANENIGIALMIRREGDMLVLEGAVTFDTVPELNSAAEEHFRQGAAAVDFAAVTEVDSAAVSLLLEWRRSALAGNRRIEFTNLPANLKSLATLYGVADLLGE